MTWVKRFVYPEPAFCSSCLEHLAIFQFLNLALLPWNTESKLPFNQPFHMKRMH